MDFDKFYKCVLIIHLFLFLISSTDNFLPDSVDKSSGKLSVSQSGEVNLNYSGTRGIKVRTLNSFNYSIKVGRESFEKFLRLTQTLNWA